MKKQINPTIKAHLIRSGFYVLLLLAVCVIPFALAQRNTGGKKTASKSTASKNPVAVEQRNQGGKNTARKSTDSKNAARRAAPGKAPATTTFDRNDPRARGK